MDPSEIRTRLHELQLERLAAESAGLSACATYMEDLQEEIFQYRAAYVGVAVTELAVARAELSGRLLG